MRVTEERQRPPDGTAAQPSLTVVRPHSPPETRLIVEQADAGSAVAANPAAIWQLLLDGRHVILDCFYSKERWFAVHAAPRDGTPRAPVSARVRQLFDTFLLGERQKIAAFDQGVCASAISLALQRGLEQLGVVALPCKAPPFLTFLARAGRGLAIPIARGCAIAVGAETYHVLSIERPELLLAGELPPAEFYVLRRLVEGATYEQIAIERGTSHRTVANQIRSVFQRLKVTSRGELIARLLEIAGLYGAPATAGGHGPKGDGTGIARFRMQSTVIVPDCMAK